MIDLGAEIIRLIEYYPGIAQHEIVKKLTRKESTSKSTIIKHLKDLVKKNEIIEEKNGNVTYVSKSCVTNKILEKRICDELDKLVKTSEKIKKDITSLSYPVKCSLLNTLVSLPNLEESVQKNIEYEKRDIESNSKELLEEWQEIRDLLNEQDISPETKKHLTQIAKYLYDKLQEVDNSSLNYYEKLHNTNNKKSRKFIKRQLNVIETNQSRYVYDWRSIINKLKFKSDDITETTTKLHERYIKEKLNTLDEINDILSKKSNLKLTEELMEVVGKIRNTGYECQQYIDQQKYYLQKSKDQYEEDDIMNGIDEKEKKKKTLNYDSEMLLQHLKSKKSVRVILKQLQEKYLKT